MSVVNVEKLVEDLPFALRGQVVGYAESVERVMPDIFREIGRKMDRRIADQVVLIAGIRKLYSIVASSYWTLDNSAALLSNLNTERIRVGGEDYSRGGAFHKNLHSLLVAMDAAIVKHEVTMYLSAPYSEVLRKLVADGHK